MPRLLPFLVFVAIALGLVGGMHYYLWARLVRDPQLPETWARVLTVTIVGLGVAMPATLFAARLLPGSVARPAIWVSFIWMGVGFLLVAFFGLADLARLLSFVVARYRGPAEPDPERRIVLARTVAAGVTAVVAGLSTIGIRSALSGIQIKQLDVKLRGLPQELAGFRLVQISDVHVGPLLRKDWVAHIVEQIRQLAPDLVAITGDLVDGRVHELREHVAPLAKIEARRGVYFVTGNHEYYSGVEEWYAHLPSLGVRPLRNERVEVAPGLELAGIEDPTGAPDLAAALHGRDPEVALVLLAHQPRQFAEAAKRGVPLTLSGHTHGGQIWPFSWLVALAQPYLAGLHRRGESQLYVSRGTGFWGPPMRVFAPAEITLLRLQPA
ncbi:MAG TPA: metallophosphoesterase [Myxococcales bacterium]|nr:metallophosphoesterase [Myxococcales bacterium]